MALTIFKLEKLTIEGYDDEARTGVPDVFEAQFNPTELVWKDGIRWGKAQTANSSAQEQQYQHTKPTQLDVTLTLDGTNVDSMGVYALRSASVNDRIAKFQKAAYTYRGDEHEPPYLRVSWGALQAFDCRLCTYSVKYTLFDRDGTPLRAELSVSFTGDKPRYKMVKEEQKSSPDLTHSRVVKSGDTLPLLTKDIYGSSETYMDVARYNGLDDFRKLVPGQELLFPPLVVFTSNGGGPSLRR